MSDGFLSRWTRRKRAARAAERDGRDTADIPEAGIVAEADGAPETLDESLPPASPDAASEPAEAAEPLPELPSLDALTRESDLAPFLRAGVPTALRNAALRRMWSIDPAIRDFVSEAREYAYDWNTPGGVPGLGPLLPSDDVQAMLRRIVGGGAGEPPMPEGIVPGDEAGTGVPDIAAAAEPRQDESEQDEARLEEPGQGGREDGPDQIAGTPLLSATMPTVEPGRVSPPGGSEAVAAEAWPTAGPGSAPRARLRRHGGAMPA